MIPICSHGATLATLCSSHVIQHSLGQLLWLYFWLYFWQNVLVTQLRGEVYTRNNTTHSVSRLAAALIAGGLRSFKEAIDGAGAG